MSLPPDRTSIFDKAKSYTLGFRNLNCVTVNRT